MKKILLTAILLQAGILLLAQNKKGNWLTGVSFGSTNFSFGDSESGAVGSPNVSMSESNNFNIGINPNLGYYLTDRIVVGATFTLGYSTSKNENSNTGSPSTSTSKSHYLYAGLGPFARFYLGKMNNKGMPYAQAGGAITFYPGYKGEYRPSGGNGYDYEYSDYHPWSLYGQFGYEHYLNPIIALHYYIAYTYSAYKYITTYHYTGFPDEDYTYKSHSSNIGFGVGLQVHLDCADKKKK